MQDKTTGPVLQACHGPAGGPVIDGWGRPKGEMSTAHDAPGAPWHKTRRNTTP